MGKLWLKGHRNEGLFSSFNGKRCEYHLKCRSRGHLRLVSSFFKDYPLSILLVLEFDNNLYLKLPHDKTDLVFLKILLLLKGFDIKRNIKSIKNTVAVRHLNPIVPKAPFLYPQKTSENLTGERVHWERIG